jgi:PAS domain S-box-containing protein
VNQDRNPFSPEATALHQRAEARLHEEEAAGDDERSSRKMMDAPRDEQDRCAQLVATVPGGLFSFRLRPDGSTCCPYANPAFLDLVGLPAEDLAESAAALWAIIHPDDLDRIRASVAASARTLTPWRDEFRWQRPTGEAVWVEGHAMPVREPDGGILWHGFLQDVTARKETERRLSETHERLQALLQALPVGVCFSDDPTCQQIAGNPTLLAQFEMTPPDNLSASAPEAAALGRRVRYLRHGRELRQVELPLQRAVAVLGGIALLVLHRSQATWSLRR